MIIKNKSIRLPVIFSILLILPYVQRQWFNLYLFNINNISFYSILYNLSGIICPSLICFNSLNNFTYYKFKNQIINPKKIFKGKLLLFLVVINLILLSFLISYYFYVNINLINELLLESIKLQETDILQFICFQFLIAILLIFKRSRILLKKFILINFIMISFFIWFIQINNIKLNYELHIYKYFSLDITNIVNIIILVAIEISFLIWSYLSYKHNLSDWIVHLPQKRDLMPILDIFIFYLFIVIYYSILT